MGVNPTTMKAQNVIDYVKRQFGDEAGVQVTDDDIIRWINTGQAEILNKNPLLKAQASSATVSGQYEYTFPENIMFVQSIMYNGRPLKQLSFQEAQDYIIEEDPERTVKGDPTMWYEWAGTFNLYPTPNSVKNLTIYYVKTPAAITTGNDLLSLPDRYYNTLLHYVLQQAYEMDEDWTASGNKASQFEASVNTLAEEENYLSRNTYPTITVLEEDM